jgi:hypothetical protein
MLSTLFITRAGLASYRHNERFSLYERYDAFALFTITMIEMGERWR